MKLHALAIAVVALTAAGCGGSDEIEAPRTAAVEPSRLVIHESHVTDGPIYIEGSISFLGVDLASAGDRPDATQVEPTGTGAVIYDELLVPDKYRVVSYQRPCDGNCGYLDPPTERCRHDLVIESSESTLAVARTRAGHRCEIRVR